MCKSPEVSSGNKKRFGFIGERRSVGETREESLEGHGGRCGTSRGADVPGGALGGLSRAEEHFGPRAAPDSEFIKTPSAAGRGAGGG